MSKASRERVNRYAKEAGRPLPHPGDKVEGEDEAVVEEITKPKSRRKKKSQAAD